MKTQEVMSDLPIAGRNGSRDSNCSNNSNNFHTSSTDNSVFLQLKTTFNPSTRNIVSHVKTTGL